jgi:hypothetical protein
MRRKRGPASWTLTHPTGVECKGYIVPGLTTLKMPAFEVAIECDGILVIHETHSSRDLAATRLATHRAMMESGGWQEIEYVRDETPTGALAAAADKAPRERHRKRR